MSRNGKTDEASAVAQEQVWARETAERLVEAARRAGASQCDATVGLGSALQAKARDGEIEDISRSRSRAAGIRVIVDGRLGFATAAEAPRSSEAIDELARTAVALAEVSTASEHNRIPEPTATPVSTVESPEDVLALWDPAIAHAQPQWAADNALAMESVLRNAEGIQSVREVGASTSWGVFALATSTGFLGSYASTSAYLGASGVADEGDGKKQVDGWWDASRELSTLQEPESIAKKAAERVLARVGAKKVASTKAPVLFDPSLSKGFFAAILSAINGDAVSRRASFLADKLGQSVLTPGIRVFEDPFIRGGFASRPFDDEGLKVQARDLIDESGVLKTWLLDARSASRLGMEPTGHATRGTMGLPYPSSSNVQVLGGQGDLSSIVADTPRGLLVTSLLGHGPDMVTGEYSRGASGFWIEDGAIVHPVEEITIAGEMAEMMMSIDRFGSDLDTRSSLHAPTIRFASLSISGS